MLTRVVHVSTLHSTCQHDIGQKVKLDHFGYFNGKIAPVVSLGCLVVQGGYFNGKIESFFYIKYVLSNYIITGHVYFKILVIIKIKLSNHFKIKIAKSHFFLFSFSFLTHSYFFFISKPVAITMDMIKYNLLLLLSSIL